ncbi:nucleoside deaminase [Kitasatospora sp. NPDC059327]|uniref:nucleoside deaminase n=1 Tax=Kitasatospora sp. NPDC059327 TaxID=3346803 RepID=UPI0036B89B2E
MGSTDGFDASWAALAPGARRCLEPAHRSWPDGGLPVGAVLADADGVIVAEGRNRGPPRGATAPTTRRVVRIRQGTPLAPAELNAPARTRTGWDLATHTLWSSHEPCGMCAAAVAFTGIGVVRFLAPDPWAVGAGRGAGADVAGPRWAEVAADLLFLAAAVRVGGPDHRTVRTALAGGPRAARTARLAVDLAARGAGTPADSLPVLLAGLRSAVTRAAA